MSSIKGYGGGGGKGGGGGGGGITEDADSLASLQYASVVDLIGEGEIGGLVAGERSIFLDGVPVRNNDDTYNFTNFQWDFRVGTQAQSAMPSFNEISNETIVATKVYAATPAVRAITDTGADVVSVTINVPSLTYTDNSGGIHGTSVSYAVDIAPSGGAYTQAFTDTVSGKTRSTYYRSTRVNLAGYGAGPWNVRVRRLTADSSSSLLQNDLYFSSFAVINTETLTYPNSALIGILINAEFFDHIPQRTYHVKGLKVRVPTNYNPVSRIYTGTWDGTWKIAYSNNPAWCFLDLCTNPRYGLGKRIALAQMDKWRLYKIAQYCDELVPTGYSSELARNLDASQISATPGAAWISGVMGGSLNDSFGGTRLYEPRFTLNCVLNTREDAYKVLAQLANVFRGMTYWQAGGSIGFSQDAPATPTQLYSEANVVNGQFSYAGSAKQMRHTVVLVGWNDPTQNFRQMTEYVEDAAGIARYGINQTEVAAFGCTSQGQARRFGLWLLYTERMQTEVCTFQVGLDSLYAKPGDTVQIADSRRAGARMGGRLISCTSTTAVLDAPVTFDPALSYTLSLPMPDGTIVSRTLSSLTGAQTNISWLSTLSTVPVAGAMWVLSEVNLTPQLFRVIGVKEISKTVFEISALEQNDSKYAAIELGMKLEDPKITSISLTPSAPTNLVVHENSFVPTVNGQTVTVMNVSWTGVQSPSVKGYVVRVYTNGVPKAYPLTTQCSLDITDLAPGSFTVSVTSVNALGIPSTELSTSFTLTGVDTTPPPDVASLSYTLDANNGVILNWPAVQDYIQFYEIKEGSTVVAQIMSLSYVVGFASAGSHTYTVKAVDNSGNYSVNAATATLTVQGANPPTVVASLLAGNLVLSWGAQQGTFNTDSYELRVGTSWAAGTVIGSVKTTTYTLSVNYSGSKTYWVAAKDAMGNYGNAGSVQVTIQVPSAPFITSQVIDNNVLLYWTDATTSLPVATYQIKEGPTWAGAAVVGTKSGLFTTVFETSAGSRTYWIAGVDTAGNVGTPGSLTVAVNAPPDYVLKFDQFSVFNGTLSSAYFDGRVVTLPVNTSETFAQHFTSNSWTSPQDQVTAGYAVYAEPSISSGYYEEVIDYGTTLAAIGVQVTPTYTVVAGTPTVSTMISVSNTSATGPWTDYPNTSQIYLSGFRWAKIRITANSSDGKSLINLTALETKLSTKIRNDGGSVSAVATDITGTIVNFNVSFIDVTSITLTPQGTTAVTAVYDFVDVPYPTSFKVYLFNSAGVRVSGTVSWNAKGY